MDQRHKSVSLSTQIFEQLERDILIGKYKRGDVLTEIKLSEEMGVSRTPIREALHRLSQEHIIHETSKGSIVIGISESDVKDIYEIRKTVESLAAQRAAENITDEEIEALKETIELQEFYCSKDNVENMREMDSRFHEQIYQYSKSIAIYDTLIPLHRKIQKYRSLSLGNHKLAMNSVEEHRELFNAISQHDAKRAGEIAYNHITNAEKRIFTKEVK